MRPLFISQSLRNTIVYIFFHGFIGEHLRVKYDEAIQVKLNKRGRLQVKDPRYKVPTALDLVYLEESPDWCRISKPLQWQGLYNVLTFKF